MSARGDRNGITNPLMPTAGYRIEAPSSTFTVEQQLPFVVIDQEKYFRHYQAFFNLKGKCIRAHTHTPHTHAQDSYAHTNNAFFCLLTDLFFFFAPDHTNYLTPKEETPDGVTGPAIISGTCEFVRACVHVMCVLCEGGCVSARPPSLCLRLFTACTYGFCLE